MAEVAAIPTTDPCSHGEEKKSAEDQGRESEGEHSPNSTIVRSGRSTFPSVHETFCISTSHLIEAACAGSQPERGTGISLEDAFPKPFIEAIDDEFTVPFLHWISDRKRIKIDSISGTFGPATFQDFIVDRTRAYIKKGQLWAIYDYLTDKMPRFYCLVDKVKEAPTFAMDVILLEPTSEEDDWLLNRTLVPATGEFRLSEWKITCRDRTMLSQLMRVGIREGGRTYEVRPQVGEVWALYADYGEVGAVERQAYDLGLVESSGHGVGGEERACWLRKLERVEGCENLWATRGEPRWYLYEDYLGRFSHRVPAVPVPCDLHGVARFCMVLDPCSLPQEDLLE